MCVNSNSDLFCQLFVEESPLFSSVSHIDKLTTRNKTGSKVFNYRLYQFAMLSGRKPDSFITSD